MMKGTLPPSFSPSVLRSFVLDVFPGNAAVVSTLPKSHSQRLPLPSPKAGWEKICHLHHCGISALYSLSKSGSTEREGFETEKEKFWRWGSRVQFNETFPISLLLHCWCLCWIINDSCCFLSLFHSSVFPVFPRRWCCQPELLSDGFRRAAGPSPHDFHPIMKDSRWTVTSLPLRKLWGL